MIVNISWISGVMIGLELLWEEKVLVVDLGIIRLMFGIMPNEQ